MGVCGIVMVVILLELVMLSEAYKFFVGGKDGWVLNPSESFDHWAQRNRFQVNDTLFFKYKEGSESVLEVNKDDYDSCNINNPITLLTGGESEFRLTRSGPFFFVPGNADNCRKGQKLHLIVLAVRPPKHQTPATAPSPSAAAPEHSSDTSAAVNAPSPALPAHRSAAPQIGSGGPVFGVLFVVVHLALAISFV